MKLKKLLPLLLLILIISNTFAIGTSDVGTSKVAPVVTFRVGAPPDAPASSGSSTSSGGVAGSVSNSLATATGGGFTVSLTVSPNEVVAGGELNPVVSISSPAAVYSEVVKTGTPAALYLWRAEKDSCYSDFSKGIPSKALRDGGKEGEFDVYFAEVGRDKSNINSWTKLGAPVNGVQKAEGNPSSTIKAPTKGGTYTYCAAFTLSKSIARKKIHGKDFVKVTGGAPTAEFLFTEIQSGTNFEIIDSKIKEFNKKSSEFYDFKNPTPFKLKLDGIDSTKNLYLAVDFTCEQQLNALNTAINVYVQNWGTTENQSWFEKVKNWFSGKKETVDTQWQKDYSAVGQLFESGQFAKGAGATTGLVVGRFVGGVLKFGVAGTVGVVAGVKTAIADLKNELQTDLTTTTLTQPGTISITSTENTSNVTKISSLTAASQGLLATPSKYNTDYWTILSKAEIPSNGTGYWQIDSINGKTPQQLNGTKHAFYACQFEFSYNESKMKTVKETFVNIKFGEGTGETPTLTPSEECKTVPDCLARIDKKFVDGIFSSTVSTGTSDSVNIASGTTGNAGTGTGNGTISGTGTASNSPAISIPDSSSTARVQPAASVEVKKKL